MRAVLRAGIGLSSVLIIGSAGVAAAAPAPAGAPVTGMVFGDANSNARPDPGEALAGVTVQFTTNDGTVRAAGITGPNGHFHVSLPAGHTYYESGHGSGWYLIPQAVHFGASGANLSIRAVRPLGHVLTAKMALDRDTYQVGDTVHLVITLANTGSTLLRGIDAACNRVGDDDELTNFNSGWGVFGPDGAGATLEPHQTQTFDVTDRVPAAAGRAGVVAVGCDFGYDGIDAGYRPTAGDSARVPGQYGAVSVDVTKAVAGGETGVADVRLVLVNTSFCPLFSRTAATDARGHAGFTRVPAGVGYALYVYPPAGLKVRFGNASPTRVFGDDTTRLGVEVAKGTATPPTLPTQCDQPSAPPTSPTGPPLASTGTDAGALAGAGGIALVAGLLLTLLGGRRRRAH